MNLLFVHQNFPAQYRHIAPALAKRGHKVFALTLNSGPALPGVTTFRYQIQRNASEKTHVLVREFEGKVVVAEAAARAAAMLKRQGFTPDVICAHPGWGEALFLKDIWPGAKLLCFCEFYYRSQGSDVNFDPEFSDFRIENMARLRVKNANNLLSLEPADLGVSPTVWQQKQFPDWIQPRISVAHDGIDTNIASPNPAASLTLDDRNLEFKHGDEVVTFVNRSLEPYRGYHIFMRSLPSLLRQRPQAHVLIVGREGTSYGARPRGGKSWKQQFLGEVADRIDLSRVHFLGQVPYQKFLQILQVSAAHVYLTYPFVLSWSLLEAMSAGCIVIGSKTPPVEEVIRHGENGLLVDFFHHEVLADTVSNVLANPSQYRDLRIQARKSMIEQYDLQTICLPRQVAMIESLGNSIRR